MARGSASTTSRKAPPQRRWFSHRRLVALEALLLAATAKGWLQNWVIARPELHDALKTIFIMAMTIGLFAIILVVVDRITARGVSATHKVAQSLPVPLSLTIVHALAWLGLFVLYAHTNNLRWWYWGQAPF
jgi:hypothetical protein